MTADAPGDVTRLLRMWSTGDSAALEQVFPLIYGELRTMAARCLRRERSGHTLEPTALVHEAYLRLIGQKSTQWATRSHFFAIAAQAMRRILVDYARGHQAAKRGGGKEKVPLECIPELTQGARMDAVEVLALDTALSELTDLDPRQAKVVELRFFAGLTAEETAAVLEVSESTVAREWRAARAWLRTRMDRQRDDRA